MTGRKHKINGTEQVYEGGLNLCIFVGTFMCMHLEGLTQSVKLEGQEAAQKWLVAAITLLIDCFLDLMQ